MFFLDYIIYIYREREQVLTYALEAKMKLKAPIRILIIYLILFWFLSSAIMVGKLASNIDVL